MGMFVACQTTLPALGKLLRGVRIARQGTAKSTAGDQLHSTLSMQLVVPGPTRLVGGAIDPLKRVGRGRPCRSWIAGFSVLDSPPHTVQIWP